MMLRWAQTPNHLAAHLYFLRGVVAQISGDAVPPVSRPFDVDVELAFVREQLIRGLRRSDRPVIERLLADARDARAVGTRKWRDFLTQAFRDEARLYAEALEAHGAPTWRPPVAESSREAEVFAMIGVTQILMSPHVDVIQMRLGLAEARAQVAEHDARGTDLDDGDRRVAEAAEAFYFAFLEAAGRRGQAELASTVH